MQKSITKFNIYLKNEKRASHNTIVSYLRDLNKLANYLAEYKIYSPKEVNTIRLNAYIIDLEKQKLATSTISRTIASIRAFFSYLVREKIIDDDPSFVLKGPKIKKNTPQILNKNEIDQLLLQPLPDSDIGIRDKAMIELLYATGIRVSELIALSLYDLNMDFLFITCHQGEKERAVPFGTDAYRALNAYLDSARPNLVHDSKETALFVNRCGMAMSRQGFWKIVKKYADMAGIDKEITPHMLRHSYTAYLEVNGSDL